MPTRDQIAQQTADALAAADLAHFPALLGFDGFVDDIIEVVLERHAPNRYDRIPSIADFGRQITSAVNLSCNMELVVTRQKLGGNGPIMGNALATLGLPLTYIGTVADPAERTGVHRVFADFAQHATLLPLAPPAHTHALEFADGKLMLGELAPLSLVTWERLLEYVGFDRLLALTENASLIGLLNWTMLPHLSELWQQFADQVFPRLSKKSRRVFVDLADPKKRNPSDLLAALSVLERINTKVPVTLGLNLSEASQVAKAVGIPPPPATPLLALAEQLRGKILLDTVVIHPADRAAASTAAGGVNCSEALSAEFPGPYCHEPQILTGAGDHFNAGFALAQLLALPLENALCLATATSGYYVRQATSPTRNDLAAFLRNLPPPQ